MGVSLNPIWLPEITRFFANSNTPPPKNILQTNSSSLAKRLIQQGRSVGLVSRVLFNFGADPKDYRYINIPEVSVQRNFSLCYRGRSVLRPHHKYFLNLFKKHITKNLIEDE